MPDLEKFKTLMQNIDSKKANRCYISTPSTSNLYNDLKNGVDLSGVEFTFGTNVTPEVGPMFKFGNGQLAIGLAFVTGMIIYADPDTNMIYNGTWNPVLTYTFPPNFILNDNEGDYNDYEDLLKDITTVHPDINDDEREEITICDLNTNKADRCVIPDKISDMFTDLMNDETLSGLTFTFGTHVTPPADIPPYNAFTFQDTVLGMGLVVYPDSIRFIEDGALTDTIWREGDGWSDKLTYTLPANFNCDTVLGADSVRDLLEDISTFIEGREVTLCELNTNKADRCITPGNLSNLYIDLKSGSDLSNKPFAFSKKIIPTDSNHYIFMSSVSTGLEIWNRSIFFIDKGVQKPIYTPGDGWDVLSYTFPDNYVISPSFIAGDIESCKDILENVVTGIPDKETTICELKNELENKTGNCIIPETQISLYDAIYNNMPLGGVTLTFNEGYLPVYGDDLVIKDTSKNISLVAHYESDPFDSYIKITGTSPDIIIYEIEIWNTTTVTLPKDFKYDTVTGLEAQKNLAVSIKIDKPSSSITVCDLTKKVYGDIGENYDFKYLWVSENGDDNNDGYTKNTPVASISKVLSILEEKSNGERQITVYVGPGVYNISDITASISNVKFINYPNITSDIMIITSNKPLKFMNSNKLSFTNITFISTENNVEQGGIALVFSNCKNIELYQCGFTAVGTIYNDAGILALNNTNCNILDCAFYYMVENTGNSAAVRLDSKSYCTWNSWSATQTGLVHLIINEGVAFFPEKIYGTTTEVPTKPNNTIGYYNQSIISSDNTVDDIVFGEKPSVAESQNHPLRMYFYEDV
jgi:hypothetical protein